MAEDFSLMEHHQLVARCRELTAEINQLREDVKLQHDGRLDALSTVEVYATEMQALIEKWREYKVANMIKLNDSVIFKDVNRAIKNTVQLCADELELILKQPFMTQEEFEKTSEYKRRVELFAGVLRMRPDDLLRYIKKWKEKERTKHDLSG